MGYRYFIEVAYKGKGFSGFQIQNNAHTIQAEVEQALRIYFRMPFSLTGSSRTDTDVNALQNFFHADTDVMLPDVAQAPYHLNAILPPGVVIRGIYPVKPEAHCRFDALTRSYEYRVYTAKNPFLNELAYFFPFPVNMDAMNSAAGLVKDAGYFESFSKKHAQVKNYSCRISESIWKETDTGYTYYVTGNRFLRGMVRGLVATMLHVGTGKMSVEAFNALLLGRKQASANFSVPGHGLYLTRVNFPDSLVLSHV